MNWNRITCAVAMSMAFIGTATAQDAQVDVKKGVRQVDPLLLAAFRLPEGNEVRFYGVPEDDELMIGEIADAGKEIFVIDSDKSPAEIFDSLAPADVPVPRMIAETDKHGLLGHRPQVETLDQRVDFDPSPVPNQQNSVTSGIAMAAAGSGSCASGSAGANYFKNNHCYSLGGPGYGSSESHCYDGSWNWLQKTSNSKRRATYTRIASCGTAQNRLRHYYRTISGYTMQVNLIFNPQKVVSWWSYKKGIKRYRRVRMERASSGGWVRGWIKYHSEVAGGW